MALACLTGPELDAFLKEAREAAVAAGELIGAAWQVGGRAGVEEKGSAVDLVTETDKACEELIFGRLRAAYPTHELVGEEGVAAGGAGIPPLTDAPTWLVDPLDGTTNFVHGFPFSCVCIGLLVEKVPVVGVVHNPVLNETFAARLGGGATLNGRPIAVSGQAELQRALLGTEFGTSREPKTLDAMFGRAKALTAAMRSVRSSGACALGMCGVALGRLDAFYEIGFGGPWDCCAAACVVREAGGELADPACGPFDPWSRRVLVTNGKITKQVQDIIASVPCGPTEPPHPTP